MELNFAKRVSRAKASEIRELLKLTEQQEMISFAGGLPAPELFPAKTIGEICNSILSEKSHIALQYSATEGVLPLRTQISRIMKHSGMGVHPEDILITTGSQQVLDLAGKVFLDEGDLIFCESPTYLAAINAFNVFMPNLIGIETDEEGIIPDSLEKALSTEGKPKFIYVIPDFQNPSGRSMSTERRQRLIEIANKEDLIIIEDNPYGEIRFEAEKRPTLKSLDMEGRVIYTSTLSKTFAPGLRIGWVTAGRKILEKFILFKQCSDLHSNTLSQMIASEYLEKYDYFGHIKKILESYRARRNAMQKAMREYLPQIHITNPEGGLFIWAVLPENIDSKDLLIECLKLRVAFVPGASFYPKNPQRNTMRLNFSCVEESSIKEGIRRISEALVSLNHPKSYD